MKNFTKIPQKIIMSSALDVYELRILCVLLSFKPCYPSYENLKKFTGISRDKINKVLRSLKDKNIIDWKKGNSRKLSNEYYICPVTTWNLTGLVPDYEKIKKDWIRDSEYLNDLDPSVLRTDDSP